MSQQHWRTFLTVDLSLPEKGKGQDTKAAQRRREVLDMITPKFNDASKINTRFTSTELLVWQGKEYPPGILPPEDVVQQILWELYELNFIHELVSLDHRACANLDPSDTAQLMERQVLIAQCFSVDSFRNVVIPSENHGFAANNSNKCFRSIFFLIVVMNSWKGAKPMIFSASPDSFQNMTAAYTLEALVTKYYCQQFFNYFGRAAQIPHRLFAVDDN